RKRSVFTAVALFSARINIVLVTWSALVARAKSPRAAITLASAASKRRRNKPGSKEISPDDANDLKQPRCVQPKSNTKTDLPGGSSSRPNWLMHNADQGCVQLKVRELNSQ